ncbi:MAG: hypothetical protein EAZ32_11065 [Cytophagia bacterium]|nr:MAG: hypothetical protein EAZ38_00690 [Cytophagales bacterium]TAG39044.1 MAG: hypothetical protein EAZ32_11065 [Cytophagia bacterium]TAG84292.1 MAG: hypothetical protein EAZ22_00855 [Cytophagales bacterium]
MELYQKTFGDKRHFKLSDDRIDINTKSFKENLEYSIKYEELGFDVFRKREKNAQGAFIFFLALDLLYICMIIVSYLEKDKPSMIAFWVGALFFFGIFTIITYKFRHNSWVYLTGGFKVLEIMNDKPSEDDVQKFIENIHSRMRSYLKKKHTDIDISMPKDYYVSQFKWLKEIKAIDDIEFKELITELDTKYLIN